MTVLSTLATCQPLFLAGSGSAEVSMLGACLSLNSGNLQAKQLSHL